MEDQFRDRVFSFLDATTERWANVRHSLDIALDISGEDDPFEGANVDHLSSIVGEWLSERVTISMVDRLTLNGIGL